MSDLSFDVPAGQLFSLVGPDGAGKTTTLRMLAAVMRPTSGDAIVNGVSIVADPEAVKLHIAYMSQRFGLYADLTVRENIDFYADLYQVPRPQRPARIEQLYSFSRLGPFEHRLAGQLSGGMKQKLSLCCALIHRPVLMLLDEPTFGVDPISRRDLWLILHQMISDGTTVVVSTSYLDEAERCDRVALLHRGRVVGLDSPHVLQNQLQGRIISIHTTAPRAARDLLRRQSLVQRATLFGEKVHVVLPDAAHDGPVVRLALEAAGIEVIASEAVFPSMEDVFLDIAGKPETHD